MRYMDTFLIALFYALLIVAPIAGLVGFFLLALELLDAGYSAVLSTYVLLLLGSWVGCWARRLI